LDSKKSGRSAAAGAKLHRRLQPRRFALEPAVIGNCDPGLIFPVGNKVPSGNTFSSGRHNVASPDFLRFQTQAQGCEGKAV